MKRIGFLLGVGVMLAATVMVGAPPVFGGQNARLYEVTESMRLDQHGKFSGRRATAALLGAVDAGSSLCPAALAAFLGVDRCEINAEATDDVNLATGMGPVEGTFHVIIQDNNTVDGAELVIATGRLKGAVDLSPVVLGPDGVAGTGDELPLGTIRAQWRAEGLADGPLAGMRDGGTLTGVFRLPFVMPGTPALYLLDPTVPAIIPVAEDERSLGAPTVRLEIDFVSDPATGL